MQSGDAGTGSEMLVKLPQTLNRRRALRTLVALTAAAAGASAGLRPQEADAYQVTNAPSTDFAGPIRATGGNSTFPDGAAVIGANPNGGLAVYGNGSTGVYGLGDSFGVEGRGLWGVLGSSATGRGMEGDSGGSLNEGVLGYNYAGGVGTRGLSSGGTGVLGQSQGGSGNTNVGVYGQAAGSSGGIGVLGLCSNDVNSVGVYAQSATGKGFLGYSNSANGVGAVGVNSTSGIGLYGISSGGYAGVFSGSVYITGDQTVLGAKSAAVRDAGGALRRLYCVESPESWFEDFGTGQLSGGSATVGLETNFAGLVHGDSYHVFVTPQGDSNGLYVSNKTPSGFTVREQQGGKSNVAFDYRLVAKRKDIAGARLEHVAEPSLPDVSEIKPPAISPAKPAPIHGG